jgi:hypothetical protein
MKLAYFRNEDTNKTQLENNMETHKVYLEMFDICSISYSTNTIIEFFLCTPKLWLIDAGRDLWNSLSKFSKGLWCRRLVYLVFHTSP